MNWGKNRFKQDPDECHDDMDINHSFALESQVVCPECGLDFRYTPPRANLMNSKAKTVPRYRFYGVDVDGWLIGDSTEEFVIERWMKSRDIDPDKPHGRRPTPPEVEAEFRHGPFYTEQDFLDH